MIWSGDSPDLSVGTPAQFVIAPACRQASLNADLSVVDIRDNEVESPDLIASRIERAAKPLGGEHPLREPGLRALDALAKRRRPKDASLGRRLQSLPRIEKPQANGSRLG